MRIFILFMLALASYFFGAVNGAIIMSKNIYKKDIREYGSGNAGLTNAYRVFGKQSVVIVLLIDTLKAAIPVTLGWWLMGIYGYPMVGKIYAGFFVILGHIFPIYYNYKGGKGVLCCCVVALILDWRVGLICLFIFAVVVVLTRYVSLGAIAGALTFPIMVGAFGAWHLEVLLAILCAFLLILKHRNNILRLIAGRENKITNKKRER